MALKTYYADLNTKSISWEVILFTTYYCFDCFDPAVFYPLLRQWVSSWTAFYMILKFVLLFFNQSKPEPHDHKERPNFGLCRLRIAAVGPPSWWRPDPHSASLQYKQWHETWKQDLSVGARFSKLFCSCQASSNLNNTKDSQGNRYKIKIN